MKHDAALIIEAIAFARGIAGRMLPCPDLTDHEHAVALLRFAAEVSE